MTERMTVVQARVPESDVRRLDQDVTVLGFATRSDALREGLRLVHRRARQAALARDHDEFYGAGQQAPLSDVTAVGDQVAVDAFDDAEMP